MTMEIKYIRCNGSSVFFPKTQNAQIHSHLLPPFFNFVKILINKFVTKLHNISLIYLILLTNEKKYTFSIFII